MLRFCHAFRSRIEYRRVMYAKFCHVSKVNCVPREFCPNNDCDKTGSTIYYPIIRGASLNVGIVTIIKT